MPPPVERSTGVLTPVRTSWNRIQDFVRNGVELGIMGLSKVREMKMLFSSLVCDAVIELLQELASL